MTMAKEGSRTAIGRNSVAGQVLMDFVQRIERVRESKKEYADLEKAIFAEIKAAGYSPLRIKEVLKRREAKPADLEEAEAELDMYLHAAGMRSEPPLFRYFGLGDAVTRDQSIEALKLVVTAGSEIIVRGDGQAMRIWRDEKGVAHADPISEEDTAAPPSSDRKPAAPRREPRDVPDVDADGARELGRAAYLGNQPITSNPFPWDDRRRAEFDLGWREASGSDGMGPEEE